MPFASLQEAVLDHNACLKMNRRTGAICSAASFRIRLGILSGPAAFETSRLFSNFATPSTMISTSGTSGKLLGESVGTWPLSLVKTLWNCLANTSALPWSSVIGWLSTLRLWIPTLYLRLVLMYFHNCLFPASDRLAYVWSLCIFSPLLTSLFVCLYLSLFACPSSFFAL